MVATAAAPRYAPPDPTLPPPWRALVDGTTGYVYYWNPETNLTQYERPTGGTAGGAGGTDGGLGGGSGTASGTKVASSKNGSFSSNGGPHCGGGTITTGQSIPLAHHVAVALNGSRAGPGSGPPGQEELRGGPGGGSLLGAPGGMGMPMGMTAGGYKRSADEYAVGQGQGEGQSQGQGQDPNSKKPRLQSYVDGQPYADALAYRREHEITVVGDNVPLPLLTFEAANFSPEILNEIRSAGFSSPSPIQAQSWPVALQGRDVVAIAKTGSGKTLGFLLPGFMHIAQRRTNMRGAPLMLVLAPTRELATQIQTEAAKYGRSSRLTTTCVYGGAAKGPQLREIERGVDVVIATPGRLNDFLEQRKVNLQQVSFLVLDEADRMLDMGFEPQIRKIVQLIPPTRQTLFFTATWPKEVRRVASDLLTNAVQVNIGNSEELVANKSITQVIEVIGPHDKQRRLEQVIRQQPSGAKIIIFCSTKRMCDQLSNNLCKDFGAAPIHGDKSQQERDYVLGQFKSGRTPILVATDVAARGLDIKDICAVINYDFPTGIEDYVHRIGRTGRAGATGLAHTFFSAQTDGKYAKDLIKVLEGACQPVPPELAQIAAQNWGVTKANRWASAGGDGGSGGRWGGRGGRDVMGGGRGDFGARGSGGDRDMDRSGGRGSMDGRGRGWGGGRGDRFGERYGERSGGRDRGMRGGGRFDGGRGRYDDWRGRPDDWRGRNDDGRGRFDDGRGRSVSPSYGRPRSRSPSYGRGRSRSPSYGRARSRSLSRERAGRRGPYHDKGRGSPVYDRGSAPGTVGGSGTGNGSGAGYVGAQAGVKSPGYERGGGGRGGYGRPRDHRHTRGRSRSLSADRFSGSGEDGNFGGRGGWRRGSRSRSRSPSQGRSLSRGKSP
ncbi:hypothetical protein CBR_g4026 [Chara braunii]|uniref:RNA helicase n=1 Tax=Chara braunii TaxID=69332 RepID=A0A388KH10_CHABU|nr:hypothetical protein CBR_g4026 [Chara braunii]|eukprot:GBG69329.1 hypothetical protein CBR_g4026 [Chara braunii]